MRLVTFSVAGRERIGVYTDQGVIDLKLGSERYFASKSSTIFSDMHAFLSTGEEGMAAAREIVSNVLGEEGNSCIAENYKLMAPVPRPEKILCPAVNYLEHGKEGGVSPPSEPYFFGKFVNSIIGPNEPIIIPSISKMPDYEVELAAIIGKRGKCIPKDKVYDFISGYTILNDISLRDLQGWPRSNQTYGPHWLMGKCADTACPLGPWIMTRDELESVYPLKIRLSVNGVVRQDADTSLQIFKLPVLISYVSQVMTLKPGDIVSTGTPSGVGRTTNTYLKEGDLLSAEIEKIGVLSNTVAYEKKI